MAGRSRSNGERFLATILFTDIVGSTDLAASLGDDNWRKLIGAHHAAVRRELRRFGGRELDTAGDGFFASFEQPAQAVRAADAILNAAAPLGLGLRAGVHVGEAERVGAKVGGIAVHLASRIMAQAGAGEVIVSSTVRDLVAGSGLEFLDRGVHELRGIPGEWHLYGLVRTDQVPVAPIDAQSVAALSADARTRRTRRLAAIAALVVVLVVGGVAVFLATRGTKAVVVTAPDTLLTIDASSGQPVEVRRVPAGPVSLALDGNDVWVASLDAGVLTAMPRSGSGSASDNRTVGRVGQPTALAAGGSVIWAADAYDEQLSLIDPATGNAEHVLNSLLARSIAYGFGSAWTTDDIHDNVARIDSQTGQVATSIALTAGAFPVQLAMGAGSVWVVDSGTSTVSRIDPQSNAVVAAAIPLRYVPTAIDGTDNDIWITSRDSDQLMRLDPSTNAVAATVQVCDQPTAVAADGTTVWVICAGAGEVWQLDHDGKQIATINAGGLPTDMVVDGGRVYVTVRQ